MTILYDTNIAIVLRDGDLHVSARIAAGSIAPAISLITRIELEGGVYANPAYTAQRRRAVDDLLHHFTVLPIDDAVVVAYGRILAIHGFSRPRILDRLIAATAIVQGLTLITINGADFRDIPGLSLEIWPTPTQ